MLRGNRLGKDDRSLGRLLVLIMVMERRHAPDAGSHPVAFFGAAEPEALQQHRQTLGEKDAAEDVFNLISGEEAASQNAMMETDTTAPTVKSITLSADSVTAPGTITVTLGVTDGGTGVTDVVVYFRYPKTGAELSCTTASQGNGEWKGTINAGEDADAGMTGLAPRGRLRFLPF